MGGGGAFLGDSLLSAKDSGLIIGKGGFYRIQFFLRRVERNSKPLIVEPRKAGTQRLGTQILDHPQPYGSAKGRPSERPPLAVNIDHFKRKK